MKKLIFVLLILLIPVLASGQFTLLHKTITVTLDNGSDTAYVWQSLSSSRYSADHSTSVIDPPDIGGFVGNMLAYITIDTVKATKPTLDSLAIGMLRTDHNGVPFGDTLFWVAGSAVTDPFTLSATNTFNTWRVNNRAAADPPIVADLAKTMWADLRGEFEDVLGIKWVIIIHDYGVDDSLQVNLHTNQMR